MKMMKTVAFLLVAFSAVVGSYQYKRFADNGYPTRTFSVDGSGDIDTVPDLATFSATVLSDGGKNVAEVQSANAEKMNKVNAFLKDKGVAKEDLKTTQYSLNPRYNNVLCTASSCPAPVIIGYSLSQSLLVKVRDNAKLGDLLSGVVGNGANMVSEVILVIDDDGAAKDVARGKAIADAKKKAVATAAAAGFRLGKLVNFVENTDMPQYGMGGDVAETAAYKAAPAPVIEPGTQNTKVQVTLTYELQS